MLTSQLDLLESSPAYLDNLTPLEKAQSNILRWRMNPVAFVRECLGVEPELWQAEMMMLVADHSYLSVRSGHGVGKSAVLSWLILWWMTCFYPAKVACTAPSSHQMFDVLWSELAMWLQKMPQALRSAFLLKSDRLQLVGSPESFASARTSRKEKPEALQGFHSENMLFLVDEASGVEDVVFEVAEGAMSTTGAKTILTGNPTRLEGYFFNSHQSNSEYVRMHVPCSASTRVDSDFIEKMLRKYGQDSSVYKVRVLGEFPSSGDNVYIPFNLANGALHRDVAVNNIAEEIWGLDVARFGGDRSALVKRRGNAIIEEPMVWKDRDLMDIVGHVLHEWETVPPSGRPEWILVDSIGLGSGVVDRLKELELPVKGINVSEATALRKDCHNLRDELYYRGREWLETQEVRFCEGCQDLIAEMCSIQYQFSSSGKLKIEAKKDMKKRGIDSPDISDAFFLTFGKKGAAAKKGKAGRKGGKRKRRNDALNKAMKNPLNKR